MQREIKFLGHLVQLKEYRLTQTRSKPLRIGLHLKQSKTYEPSLVSAGYYRKFIQNYSKVAAPLTELLKDEQRFKWGEEQQQRSITSSMPLQQHPSSHTWHAATIQSDNRCMQPSNWSSTVTEHWTRWPAYSIPEQEAYGTEQNWPAHEQEMYAVV